MNRYRMCDYLNQYQNRAESVLKHPLIGIKTFVECVNGQSSGSDCQNSVLAYSVDLPLSFSRHATFIRVSASVDLSLPTKEVSV